VATGQAYDRPFKWLNFRCKLNYSSLAINCCTEPGLKEASTCLVYTER
jgi:hypothetical protein